MTLSNPFSSKLLAGIIVLCLCAAEVGLADAVDQTEDEEPSTQQTHKPEAGEPKKKRDSDDRYRILPIPIFITEPAVGEGLGLALTLFHPVKDSQAEIPGAATPSSIAQVDGTGQAPPVVTAVFGAYTKNETWVAGVGHTNHWRNDSIRYSGVAGIAQINSEFYVLNRPLEFSMETALVYQDLKFRVKRSNIFLGAKLSYLDATNTFGIRPPAEAPENFLAFDVNNVGLAVHGSYDNRDNVMNPGAGQLIDLSLWRYDDALGGNYDYWSSRLKALWFHPLGSKLTLGLRLDITWVDGSPPFFGYPYVKLRGIPALRYQDKIAGAIEAEVRYRIVPKWEVLAFAGKGYTSDKVVFFDNPDNIYNFGFGARYNIFQAHKVWLGIDIARGPDDWNWYVQVGHPW